TAREINRAGRVQERAGFVNRARADEAESERRARIAHTRGRRPRIAERQVELRQESDARLAHVLSGAALIEERLLIAGSVGERERDSVTNRQRAPLCGRAAVWVIIIRRRQLRLRLCGLRRRRRLLRAGRAG